MCRSNARSRLTDATARCPPVRVGVSNRARFRLRMSPWVIDGSASVRSSHGALSAGPADSSTSAGRQLSDRPRTRVGSGSSVRTSPPVRQTTIVRTPAIVRPCHRSRAPVCRECRTLPHGCAPIDRAGWIVTTTRSTTRRVMRGDVAGQRRIRRWPRAMMRSGNVGEPVRVQPPQPNTAAGCSPPPGSLARLAMTSRSARPGVPAGREHRGRLRLPVPRVPRTDCR